ncbi:MAG: diadenylate cyclase CdaA [Chlamydiia bacterium]|nr:diadenylate cyclase CdaA [Chlamydiia bacterium]
MLQILTPLIEVGVIAIFLYYLFNFFWNTRTMDLLWGVGAFLIFYAIVRWLQLPVLHAMLYYLGNVAVLALIVIFQPELRLALAKLSVKGKKFQEITEFDKFLDGLAHSTYRLAERKIGALIVIEHQDSLDEYAKKSVLLNAEFSSELLESIFSTHTPIHDGAVVIRENTILSAATILPLSDDTTQLSKSMGTRHRAALGLSQVSDALIIVVSEETGRVSIAREGIITRGIKLDRFKGILRSIFTHPKSAPVAPLKLTEWLRTW